MAKISIKTIQNLLSKTVGEVDQSFLEIRFDDAERPNNGIDVEMKNRVITADCSYGLVTILFDERGQLRALEIS